MSRLRNVLARITAALPVIMGISVSCAAPPNPGSLWARGNLHAWEIANWDLRKRTPDERARLLKKMGIGHYAYLPSTDPTNLKPDVSASHLDIDAEIAAMQKHGIEVRAWFFWINKDHPAEEPEVGKALEAFKRHGIRPQIWLPPSYGQSPPESMSPQQRQQRINWEADRIAAFVKLAAPYGCKVNLYGHPGWLGRMENQLEIIDQLRKIGVTDVGIVYNITHSRATSEFKDDADAFPQLWSRIKPYVVAINTEHWRTPFRTIGMMRVIQDSGWTGPVGMFTVGYGDAEFVLRNALYGLEWSVAELEKPSSGIFDLTR